MRFRTQIGKLNFYLKRNPQVIRRDNWRDFVPYPYKSVVLISADFELAWAWRYSKSSENPLNNALAKARQERSNIPGILNLCEHFNIPITWAIIGHLMLSSCNRINGIAHDRIIQPAKFESKFWRFNGNDWFEHDPCTSVENSPEWYCPDLIRSIIDSRIPHEIGCHTFSHIDCSDHLCPKETLISELDECERIAREWGLTFESFVHPGHRIGNIETLASKGYTNFRTDNRNLLGYPTKHKSGIWELEQTSELALRDDWSPKYHKFRYRSIIRRAISNNSVCVLWFHPSFHPAMIYDILPDLFTYLNNLRDEIWVTTHKTYFTWLENSSTNERL